MLNVIGKIFGIIIANRLNNNFEYNQSQVGSIKRYSVSDAVLALRTINEKYVWLKNKVSDVKNQSINKHAKILLSDFLSNQFNKGKCDDINNSVSIPDGEGYVIHCFIDISKAFPGVIRHILKNKLARNSRISSKLLLCINKICDSFKFSMVTDNGLSDFIQTEWGIPEGSVLSALLWAVSKNDFTNGICDNINRCYIPVLNNLNTSSMMYVDDEVLSSLSYNGMCTCIKNKERYLARNGSIPNVGKIEILTAYDPTMWKLEISVDEVNAKLTLLGNDSVTRDFNFSMCGRQLRIVDKFKYLGTMIDSAGSWRDNNMKRHQVARNAFGKIYRAFRQCKNLPFEVTANLTES